MPNRHQKALIFIWPALLGLLLSAVLLRTAAADVDDDAALPPVKISIFNDLQAVADTARARRLPMLIMFAMEGCGYCKTVEEEFLKPMLRSGEYKDRVIMGEVRLDPGTRIRDFNGRMISADQLALRYGAPVTPTVIFVGPEGQELSPKLIGVSTVYFYGGDLDNGIDQALQKMRPTSTAMRPSL